MNGAGMKEKSLIKHPFYARLPTMETKQAIISFSQGEKVKSGLIWCNQCVQLAQSLPEPEKIGAVKVLQGLVAMIANEVQLARQVGKDQVWLEVEKNLNTARVMIESGIVEEATYHFTQTLSQVNRISQKALTYLVNNGLFA
jgi:hypothetical protein